MGGDAAKAIRSSFAYRSFTPEQVTQLRTASQRDFLEQLKAKYPPGGFPGFVWWSLTDGTMECPRIFSDSTTTLRLKQRRGLWVVRLSLSFILITAAILTQVLGLGPPRPKPDPDLQNDKADSEPQDLLK